VAGVTPADDLAAVEAALAAHTAAGIRHDAALAVMFCICSILCKNTE